MHKAEHQQTFEDFHQAEMRLHSNSTNRRLHFLGFVLMLVQVCRCIFICFDLATLLAGFFGFFLLARVGHLFFEPRTADIRRVKVARIPWHIRSLYKMLKEIATGQTQF